MKKKHYIIYLMLFILSFFLIENVSASSTCTYDNGKMGIKLTIDGNNVSATNIYSNYKIVSYPTASSNFTKSGTISCPSAIYYEISEPDPDGIGYSFSFTNSKNSNSVSLKSSSMESVCNYSNGNIGIKFLIKDQKVTSVSMTGTTNIVSAPNDPKEFIGNNGSVTCPPSINAQIYNQDPDGVVGYQFKFGNDPMYPIKVSLNGSLIGNETKPSNSGNQNTPTNQTTPSGSENKGDGKLPKTDCDAIFGDPEEEDSVAHWLQWGLNLMKYIAIIALLALSTIDFIKALVADDKDAVKKASVTTAKRFIYAVIIFFLPIIVEILMNLFGAYGTCGIG